VTNPFRRGEILAAGVTPSNWSNLFGSKHLLSPSRGSTP
jgi:hypothetical protein